MFEKFFDNSVRMNVLRNSPGGRLLEEFAGILYKKGYAEITARKHLRAAEHFMYWSNRNGTPVSSLSDIFLEAFGHHLNHCHCPGYGHSNQAHLLNGARIFLKHLRSSGVITAPIAEVINQQPDLLVAFNQWMRQQRGTSDPTLYNYSLSIRELLKRIGEDPGKFDARNLRQFVLERSRHCGWAAAKHCTTALRMFLRFLIAEGKCASGLDAAIPALAHWRLSSLPRYLQSEDVERIILSCDPTSPVGIRDRAILLLLARLAFRAGDILQLRLSDVDWEGAEIHVSGKGHQQTRLPLTQEVGNALVSYLQDGRPSSDADVIFIRSRAPFRAFRSHCAISVIVTRAMHRAGVTCQNRGAAHLLRHSAATSMLQQGVSLQDIAAILRHRSIQTTQIYAKVDVAALQQIAQPWPEVQPC